MTDRYARFAHSGAGHAVVRRLRLPDPVRLRRYTPDEPVIDGPVLLGGAGRLVEPVGKMLGSIGVPQNGGPPAALVFDATGIPDSTGLRSAYDFFHPVIRSLRPCGRVVVLATPPETAATPREATAQQALDGLVRSIGKEVGHGGTANLGYVTAGAEDAIESTLRFLLSPRSAYVSGQVVRIRPATVPVPADWQRPLAGTTAVVTGAARGIGTAIAQVLARDGAHVICLDVPAAGDALAGVANEIRGSALQLDLTAPDAPKRLADHVATRHGTLDAVVHNAGITRDRTLARMTSDEWDAVLDVNLSSQERINDALLGRDLIADGGRIVAVSSISGIGGNRGQTNYTTSKAGVIGLVRSLAPALAPRGITVNAVAPGFIETRMTAAMPVMAREAGRRLNSLAQGGLPVDVAETIAWLAAPASTGVTGNVVRVCGQSLLGA
jgi:3-oxoacyl-[acyl-carrier protein] reductase